MVWPCDNGTGYVDLNAPQCYVVCALPVSFFSFYFLSFLLFFTFFFLRLNLYQVFPAFCLLLLYVASMQDVFPELLVMFFPWHVLFKSIASEDCWCNRVLFLCVLSICCLMSHNMWLSYFHMFLCWWDKSLSSLTLIKWPHVFSYFYLCIFSVLWQLSPSSGTQTPFLSV